MPEEHFWWKSFDFAGRGDELLPLLTSEPHLFILQSSQHDPQRGRYTFIGYDPFDVYMQKGEATLRGLKEAFERFADRNLTAPFTPLTSGIVGCISYDFGLRQEHVPIRSVDDLKLPDCVFGFYDRIITIDHFTQKLYVVSSGLPEEDETRREIRARTRLNEAVERLAPHLESLCEASEDIPAGLDQVAVTSNMTRDDYMSAVRRALDHIREGDIYQVNLSQRFEVDLGRRSFDPVTFYRTLSQYAPTPFGGYFDGGNFRLISNSPERFLSLSGRIVQTRPMKGTRPRGQGKKEDRVLRRELWDDQKEKAELLMITDLQRNDLGRVCKYGTVAVSEQRTLEEYQYVFQATSNIRGELREDKDCFDVIEACFPGGSITGCPKIRAMNIIDKLEPARRGMYTGAMGYINFNGDMDLNIMIRTLVAKGRKLYFHVGGGIVADSDPAKEYAETLTKAGALRACLAPGSNAQPAEGIIVRA